MMSTEVIQKLEREYPFFNLKVELPKDFYLSKDIEMYSKRIEANEHSFFIHGRAGTGKSTFINYFRNISKKGYCFNLRNSISKFRKTIHSLFKFPPRLINNSDIKPLPPT